MTMVQDSRTPLRALQEVSLSARVHARPVTTSPLEEVS